eukprot:7152469-Pyramimonas_sp.AAC.1
MPKWAGGRMRRLPLGPSVEPPMGPRNVRGYAEMRGGSHADPATGAIGGSPHGATKRVRVR